MDTKDLIYFTVFSAISWIFIFREYIHCKIREYMEYKIHCNDINSKLLNGYREQLDSTIEDLQGLKSIIRTHQKYFKEIVRTSAYKGEEWKNKILDEILIEKLDNFNPQQHYEEYLIKHKDSIDEFINKGYDNLTSIKKVIYGENDNSELQ